MNSVQLIGRITKDPELRSVPIGNNQFFDACSFVIAVARDYKTKTKDNPDGEYLTDFINCQVAGSPATYMGKYIQKGNLIAIQGSICIDSFTDKNGNQAYITKVKCRNVSNLTPRPNNSNSNNNNAAGNGNPSDFMNVDPNEWGGLPFG